MSDADIVIIGAGVAGLTAAIHAARLGARVVVVAEMGVGGQIINAPRIENFPGFPDGVSGVELGPALHEQAEIAGADFVFDTVEAVERNGAGWIVRGAGETLATRAIIIAAGSRPRQLGVPGEERLTGRGVSHCASCDGPLYRAKHVFVAGGGDAAFDEALTLAEFAASVVILCRSERPRAHKALRDRVAGTAHIDVMTSTGIKEISGEKAVSALVLRGPDGATRVEAADGLFVQVGLAPNTDFLGGQIALAPDGRIVVDSMMRTSAAGVFAAGDIRADSVALLAASAGDGATAAVAAARHLADN
jgi:thioredoxin reductase (NADPH)